jgi:hypothetical protein
VVGAVADVEVTPAGTNRALRRLLPASVLTNVRTSAWKVGHVLQRTVVCPSDTTFGGVSPTMKRARFRIDAPAYLRLPIIVSVG